MTVSTDHHIKLSQFVTDMQELLEKYGDRDVILSKDGEGNGYSPYSDSYSIGLYRPETTWYGEFASQQNMDEEPDEYGYIKEDAVEAIVLWPVN